jgi:hypothetical protein
MRATRIAAFLVLAIWCLALGAAAPAAATGVAAASEAGAQADTSSKCTVLLSSSTGIQQQAKSAVCSWPKDEAVTLGAVHLDADRLHLCMTVCMPARGEGCVRQG